MLYTGKDDGYVVQNRGQKIFNPIYRMDAKHF